MCECFGTELNRIKHPTPFYTTMCLFIFGLMSWLLIKYLEFAFSHALHFPHRRLFHELNRAYVLFLLFSYSFLFLDWNTNILTDRHTHSHHKYFDIDLNPQKNMLHKHLFSRSLNHTHAYVYIFTFLSFKINSYILSPLTIKMPFFPCACTELWCSVSWTCIMVSVQGPG